MFLFMFWDVILSYYRHTVKCRHPARNLYQPISLGGSRFFEINPSNIYSSDLTINAYPIANIFSPVSTFGTSSAPPCLPSLVVQTSVKRLMPVLLPHRAPSSAYPSFPSSLRGGKSCAHPGTSSLSLHTLQVLQGRRSFSTQSWRTCQRYGIGGS